MLKPIIELKAVEFNQTLTQETNCYSATVYVDGVKFGVVGNEGHGGGDRIYEYAKGKTQKDFDELEARIKATYPKTNLASEGEPENLIDTDLELICGELVEAFLLKRDMKNKMKTKVLFIIPGEKGVFQIKLQKPHPVAKHTESIRKRDPEAIVLNELPDDEALKLFKANVTQR